MYLKLKCFTFAFMTRSRWWCWWCSRSRWR